MLSDLLAGEISSVTPGKSVREQRQPNSPPLFRLVHLHNRRDDRSPNYPVFQIRSRFFRVRSLVSVFYARGDPQAPPPLAPKRWAFARNHLTTPVCHDLQADTKTDLQSTIWELPLPKLRQHQDSRRRLITALTVNEKGHHSRNAARRRAGRAGHRPEPPPRHPDSYQQPTATATASPASRA